VDGVEKGKTRAGGALLNTITLSHHRNSVVVALRRLACW
jgi:hypothetical protein